MKSILEFKMLKLHFIIDVPVPSYYMAFQNVELASASRVNIYERIWMYTWKSVVGTRTKSLTATYTNQPPSSEFCHSNHVLNIPLQHFLQIFLHFSFPSHPTKGD